MKCHSYDVVLLNVEHNSNGFSKLIMNLRRRETQNGKDTHTIWECEETFKIKPENVCMDKNEDTKSSKEQTMEW